MSHTAFIALGSNVGDRSHNIQRAIDRIRAIQHTQVTAIATPIDTAPVDCPPGSSAFLNSAITVQTTLGVKALFAQLKAIETEMGRLRSIRNAPRAIDLDLLLFDDAVVNERDLIIPHPRLHERAFVLIPLAEIAPEIVHPVLQKTIREIRDAVVG